MLPVDEGLIHAWLDGQLSPDEAARVARLVETEPAWSAAAAEARGLIAGASRVLGALDNVPRASAPATTVSPGPASKGARWGRTPWLRAAASVVLVAGAAGAAWQLLAPSGTEILDVPGSPAPVVTPAAADREAPVPAKAPPPVTPSVSARAQGARPPETERRQATARVADAVTGGAGTGRSAAANVEKAAEATAVAAAPPPPTAALPRVEQGVVGQVAGSVPPRVVETRLAGCWIRIDSAGSAQTFAFSGAELDVPLRDVVGLRFITPVATDLALAQRSAGGRGGRPAASVPVTGRLRLTALPVNATTRAVTESTFVAEFIDAQGRAQMDFAISQDTLRGTLRRTAADLRYPPVAFVGVRADCPR